ncbi:anaerobic sulfatase maturase [candidate division KSB1 bacterium]|nr:anaerobic sulfatase maturase [candidate division KSB1 bacterium]RQW05020.1 MAG: anaerobic sulfatase maturase [candidate division KSB1 bacterium]
MVKTSREFQIFVKPAGARCNLACQYCYYLNKEQLYSGGSSFRMSEDLLETYIIQHIDASTEPVITFSWHGGEPTILGLDYFRTIVALQRRHKPANQKILNGIQTNGTLLDDAWCHFFKQEGFAVGISIDGPPALHNIYRVGKTGKPSYAHTLRGYNLLRKHEVLCEILCVVNARNVFYPLQVYRTFKQLGAKYISFLPLVEPPDAHGDISPLTVPSEAFGDFLIAIFDDWLAQDIGRIKVQIFEEAARTAFKQEHTLCIFKETCGGVPVLEHNGDFYSCDFFVENAHLLGNIRERPLAELLDSPAQQKFGRAKLDTLPTFCRECTVRTMCNGGCPKNRFKTTPDGEPGLNYLCAGYKRFFSHCQPFVNAIASQWHQDRNRPAEKPTPTNVSLKVGRNDPCPCGSGKKYKNCCLRF